MAKTKKKFAAKNAALQMEVKNLQNQVAQMSVKTSVKKTKKKAKKAKVNVGTKNPFGPVSTITTAPVAIGNSVRGSAKQITKTANGVRLRGRDFMFTPIGTLSSVTTWCTVGGTPLTPAAFADSVIANYQRMFMKFRFHSFVVHYITSSATSTSGDIMFYYGKDRSSVYLNQTSSQLLPFVFTDENTVLGPQWTNHSARFSVSGNWKLTDYGMHDGVEEYADGEVFLLSKTVSTDAPGYVLFDYDVEFAQESFQPRLLSFPIPKIQYYQTNIGLNENAITTGTVFNAQPIGNNLSGTAADVPSGVKQGDLYKIVVDLTNSDESSWVNVDSGTLLQIRQGTYGNGCLVTDGFTCYAMLNTSNNFYLFQNAEAAYSGASFMYFNVNATVTFNLQIWMSYIGTTDDIGNRPNF
jgi:hypothetical protein